MSRPLSSGPSLLLLLLVLATSSSACRGDAPDTQGRLTTQTDGLGRAVELPAEVRRVVSLAPNLTEIVHAAGAWGRLAGVTTADDYPPGVDSLARFSALPVDFEAIAALRPDLVLATDQINSPRDAESLQALGIPTYFFSFDELKDVPAALRKVGELLGTAPQANAAGDALETAFDSLRTASAARTERPSVLVLAGDEALYSFGAESFVHELVALAGGRSVMDSVQTAAPILSEEYVLRADPDYIIGTFGRAYDGNRLLALHPSWTNLNAVRNRRVYSLDGALVSRPGPRLLEGVRQIAAILHPPAPTADGECAADAPAPCL